MYNGIGLQTARGSGTNGYVQTNKFFIRPKTAKVLTDSSKGYEPDQGTAGLGKKPNKEILEHDRKRQIELKLAVLEDKLIDQGYTDAEIVDKLNDARASLEAAHAAASHYGGNSIIPIEKNVSDTQTHQIAARKEKQLETLRAALGISMPEDKAEKHPGLSDLVAHENDDEKPRNHKKGISEGDGEYEEGEILRVNEDKDARLGFSNKGHNSVRDTQSEERDHKQKKQGRSRKVDDKKKRRAYSSTESDSDSMQSTDSEHDSPIDTKRKQSSQRKSKKKMLSSSDSSASDSDDSVRAHGRRRPGRQIHKHKKHEERKAQGRKKKNFSESSDSDTERKKSREISDESDHRSDDSGQKHQRRGSNRHDSDSDSDTKMKHQKGRLDKLVKPSDDSGRAYQTRESVKVEKSYNRHDSDSDSNIRSKDKSQKSNRIIPNYNCDSDDSDKNYQRRKSDLEPKRHERPEVERHEKKGRHDYDDEHKDDNRGRNKHDNYRKVDAEIADKRDDTRFRKDRDTQDEDGDHRRTHGRAVDEHRRLIQEDRWIADDSSRRQHRDEMEYGRHRNDKRGRRDEDDHGRDEDDHGRRRHERARDSSKRTKYEESSPSHRSHRDHARHNEDRWR